MYFLLISAIELPVLFLGTTEICLKRQSWVIYIQVCIHSIDKMRCKENTVNILCKAKLFPQCCVFLYVSMNVWSCYLLGVSHRCMISLFFFQTLLVNSWRQEGVEFFFKVFLKKSLYPSQLRRKIWKFLYDTFRLLLVTYCSSLPLSSIFSVNVQKPFIGMLSPPPICQISTEF